MLAKPEIADQERNHADPSRDRGQAEGDRRDVPAGQQIAERPCRSAARKRDRQCHAHPDSQRLVQKLALTLGLPRAGYIDDQPGGNSGCHYACDQLDDGSELGPERDVFRPAAQREQLVEGRAAAEPDGNERERECELDMNLRYRLDSTPRKNCSRSLTARVFSKRT